MTQQLAALPGVSELTVSSQQPPPGVGWFSVGLQGENSAGNSKGDVAQNAVAPGFFSTFRIPLRAGRTFADGDDDNAVIVSRAIADHFWSGASAVGRRIRLGPTQPWLTIVGVVANVEM